MFKSSICSLYLDSKAELSKINWGDGADTCRTLLLLTKSLLMPDKKRFPAVNLLTKKNMLKSAPIIINAANEIFVDQFLKSKISFNSIYSYLSLVLKDKNYIKYANMKPDNIEAVLKIDKWARNVSMFITNRAKQSPEI